MGIGNKKNILLTTMSTLKAVNNVNYYFASELGEQGTLFCDGISAVENGSKYILSKYSIDEILVVGSAETFCQRDREGIENLLDKSNWEYLYNEWVNDYQRGTAKQDGKGISAFEYYKLRMAEFIHQKNVISAETVSEFVSEEGRRVRIKQIAMDVLAEMQKEDSIKQIEEYIVQCMKLPKKDTALLEKIRRQIKQIVSDVFAEMQKEDSIKQTEEYIVQCMKLPQKSMELLKKIRQRIMDDIKQSFKGEDSYLQYIRRKKVLYSKRIDIALKSQEYQKIREEIEQDKSLSILEREFLFVSLQRKIDALYYNKEKIHLEAEAEELRKENAKLQYQIQDLKNKRLEKELAYAKYIIYQSLNEKNRMKPCIDVQQRISLQFIPERTPDGFDNVTGIVNEIYAQIDGQMDSVDLFVDMQGGSRTSGYVRNAVLSILSNQETNRIQIKEIVATEFNPQESWVSQIVNETGRYRIHDLVSGMNAFIRYGKADMLVKYCEDMAVDKDSRTMRLVNGMKQVDDAISLCDPSRLEAGMGNLIYIINEKAEKEGDYVSNLFQAVEDGIKKDYEGFLSGPENEKKIDYLELVDWCRKKRLIQQALTIIEDKIPGIVLEKLVNVKVLPSTAQSNNSKYLEKLSKIFFNRSSPQGDEKNILFYGLTKKINGLWKCNYKSKYGDGYKKEILDSHNANKTITNNYCQYMLGNWQFQQSIYDDLRTPDILKKLVWNNQYKYKYPYKTLAGLTAGTYELNDDAGNTIKLKIELEAGLRRQDLEKLLLLHAALKQERNNCNHASEQRHRLPLEIVSRAIGEYVERFHNLLGINNLAK